MEINSRTILKAILGQVIHLKQAIQVENGLTDQRAKALAHSMLSKGMSATLQVENDEFINTLNKLIDLKKETGKDYTDLLQIKEIYKQCAK